MHTIEHLKAQKKHVIQQGRVDVNLEVKRGIHAKTFVTLSFILVLYKWVNLKPMALERKNHVFFKSKSIIRCSLYLFKLSQNIA